MPTFQIITGAVRPEDQVNIAERVGIAASNVGQPIDDVRVVFLAPQAVFLRGKEPVSPAAYARVDVTIGGLTDQQRRQLARDVCGALCDAEIDPRAVSVPSVPVTAGRSRPRSTPATAEKTGSTGSSRRFPN
jgi:hypothetical protein